LAPSTLVTAHYYINGMPRVAACATVYEARAFLQRDYDDPDLGAVALEIRVATGLGESGWKNAFDRILEDRDYGGTRICWPVERDALPKCVIAGYRSVGRPNVQAFTTVDEALEFFSVTSGTKQRVEAAKLRIHLTASDVLAIVPAHVSFPRAWDLALDIVLSGRVAAASPEDAVLRDAGKAGTHAQTKHFVDPQVVIAAA
jgi:hypothetical protein